MWSLRLLLVLPACLALRHLEPPPPTPSSGSRDDDVITGHFDIRLTHFHASNTDTFQMRYMYNRNLMLTNESPDIVIFVGGEWSISAGWLQAGLAYELAQEINAGLFYTEHRYYGQTRPSNDTSTSDLRWLTVDQALADLAQFIQIVKSEDFEEGIYRDAKVILVGCSYAGSMATWMRLAYPHLIDAAFSDSGPLHAQEDFPGNMINYITTRARGEHDHSYSFFINLEYLELISEAISTQGGEECVTSIREGMTGLQALVQSSPEAVSTMFNTCSQLDSASALDRATFFWFGITETFAYLVQYATPGDIPAACEVLTDATVADATQRLANWITQQPWTNPCIETRYSEVIDQHTNTSYDASQAVMRLWTYQTCVEFGWYQTTSGSEQPFLEAVPLEYFHQMCRDFFATYFDDAFLRSGIERTNTFFGGLTFLPDHVVSVAGGHDPWSPMGPNATHATTLAPVYVVEEVSHCRAIQPQQEPSVSATPELELVKRAVKNHLRVWSGYDPVTTDAGNSVILSTALLLAGLIVAL